MREVVSLHVGQAGVQIGEAMWELYCLEHGVDETGMRQGQPEETNNVGTFFNQSSKGILSPNALFLDLEPSVIDNVKQGRFRDLYNTDMMLNCKEDAANNYARGHYSCGFSFLDSTVELVRRSAEAAENLHGFMLYHSFGGGTGSGFESLLIEHLCYEYNKIQKIDIGVFPSPQISTSVVEPYNSVFTTHSTMEQSLCTFIADNQAMYKICKNKLDLDSPNYRELNRLMAQAFSALTLSLRFEGSLNVDLNEFQTNLVPFPRIHFPVVSYSPIIDQKLHTHESLSTADITRACFDPESRLMECVSSDVSGPTAAGRYMACCLMYRGDVTPKEVNSAIARIKDQSQVQFVDWSPAGVKVGINTRPPSVLPESSLAKSPRSLTMASNMTATRAAWERINTKFDLLYSRKAFVHWYLAEGMEESEFLEAREDLAVLENDYHQLESESVL